MNWPSYYISYSRTDYKYINTKGCLDGMMIIQKRHMADFWKIMNKRKNGIKETCIITWESVSKYNPLWVWIICVHILYNQNRAGIPLYFKMGRFDGKKNSWMWNKKSWKISDHTKEKLT